MCPKSTLKRSRHYCGIIPSKFHHEDEESQLIDDGEATRQLVYPKKMRQTSPVGDFQSFHDAIIYDTNSEREDIWHNIRDAFLFYWLCQATLIYAALFLITLVAIATAFDTAKVGVFLGDTVLWIISWSIPVFQVWMTQEMWIAYDHQDDTLFVVLSMAPICVSAWIWVLSSLQS